jgi:hypothetical protein
MKVTRQVPPPLTWHIIIGSLFPIVSTCVLKQSCGHWLLNDALDSTISMVLKLKDAHKILPNLQNLMEEESIVVVELTCCI